MDGEGMRWGRRGRAFEGVGDDGLSRPPPFDGPGTRARGLYVSVPWMGRPGMPPPAQALWAARYIRCR